MKVKTIDIQAKEWFDKTYGNSYFSAQVTINYGLADAKTLYIPFQYGYGSQYETAAVEALIKAGISFGNNDTLWSFCQENKIILRRNKQENCLKREAKAFGEA